MGRSVPGSGFNVPVTSNNIFPGLRLVFRRQPLPGNTGKYNEAGRKLGNCSM